MSKRLLSKNWRVIVPIAVLAVGVVSSAWAPAQDTIKIGPLKP